MITQKITPYLWVEKDAKAVADYYLSIFKDGKLKDFRKFGSDESGNDAGIETAVIEIAGMEFSILAAGPLFKFNESMSVMVYCDTQEDVDYYWEKLTEEGTESMCGWLKDKFGVSWQIIPREMGEYYNAKDKEKSSRAVNAMFQMKKLDINEIKKAFNGN